MPWNEAGRKKYEVIRGRYSSDMPDAEFALLSSLLRPKTARAQADGCPILNALFYTNCHKE